MFPITVHTSNEQAGCFSRESTWLHERGARDDWGRWGRRTAKVSVELGAIFVEYPYSMQTQSTVAESTITWTWMISRACHIIGDIHFLFSNDDSSSRESLHGWMILTIWISGKCTCQSLNYNVKKSDAYCAKPNLVHSLENLESLWILSSVIPVFPIAYLPLLSSFSGSEASAWSANRTTTSSSSLSRKSIAAVFCHRRRLCENCQVSERCPWLEIRWRLRIRKGKFVEFHGFNSKHFY